MVTVRCRLISQMMTAIPQAKKAELIMMRKVVDMERDWTKPMMVSVFTSPALGSTEYELTLRA